MGEWECLDVQVGDEVYWNDPDEGLSSGIYRIHSICTESGVVEGPNDMLVLKNEDGSMAEVFAHELA